jgi:hypothetical protein
LVTGREWAVVIGGAGDAMLAENAVRGNEQKLRGRRTVNGKTLLGAVDSILDSLYSKYVDKDPQSEGVALVIGAVCGDELNLISTRKRVPQSQEFMAYAGIGADIGIYFIDRLHRQESDWNYTATVAGFTLQQALESCQYCGGETEIYVLQRPPNPRWRFLGKCDAPSEFFNSFQSAMVSEHLAKLVQSTASGLDRMEGYQDEHHPDPLERREALFKLNDILTVMKEKRQE